jgi:hypothetical protein
VDLSNSSFEESLVAENEEEHFDSISNDSESICDPTIGEDNEASGAVSKEIIIGAYEKDDAILKEDYVPSMSITIMPGYLTTVIVTLTLTVLQKCSCDTCSLSTIPSIFVQKTYNL